MNKIPPFLRGPRRELWDVDGALTSALIWKRVTPKTLKTLLFFIPGNPGVIEYYEEFLQCLYAFSGASSLDIVGVQHAGHAVQERSIELKSSSEPTHDGIPTTFIRHNTSIGLKELFDRRNLMYKWNLDEQIQHKVAILEYLLSSTYKGCRVIIAGHSIGSYVGTQLLKHISNPNAISRVINLFPTIEHIRKTPNGDRLWPLFTPIGRNAAVLTARILHSFLSKDTITWLVSTVMSQQKQDAEITAKLVHPHIADNTLYMAKFEMEQILDLDEELFDRYIDKMIFYYGQRDEWVPLERYHLMRKRYPDAMIHLCQNNLPHAFVLSSGQKESPEQGEGSTMMAEIVFEWISKDL